MAKASTADKLRGQLEEPGAAHCFPGKPNRKKRCELNKRLHRQFHRMENFFCRLKRRACACACARHFNFLIEFASVIAWIRHGS